MFVGEEEIYLWNYYRLGDVWIVHPKPCHNSKSGVVEVYYEARICQLIVHHNCSLSYRHFVSNAILMFCEIYNINVTLCEL